MINSLIMKKISQPQKRQQRQAGFSLVEVAIAVTCLGLLLGGTLMIMNAMKQARNIHDTENKMSIIADHLSMYAQAHNRLPCPASPIRQNYSSGGINRAAHFGDERRFAGNAADINRAADCFDNQGQSHGIVPYRALGLSEEYATDAWGRYFTYVVSPVSARYNYVNTGLDNSVSIRVAHYIDTDQERSLSPKYRFCHGMPTIPRANGFGTFASNSSAFDIQHNPDVAASFPYNRALDRQVTLPFGGADPDRLFANDVMQGGLQVPYTIRPAYALISHGNNGFGAYFGNETNNKNAFLGLRPSETANARVGMGGAANTVFEIGFADGPTAPAALLFDDIVLVQTQDQVFGRKGGQSCVTP